VDFPDTIGVLVRVSIGLPDWQPMEAAAKRAPHVAN
jgi:hypothetical protein